MSGSVSEDDTVTHEKAQVSLPVTDAARMAAGYTIPSSSKLTLNRLVEDGTVDPEYATAVLSAPPMEEPQTCWNSLWPPVLVTLAALAFDHFFTRRVAGGRC